MRKALGVVAAVGVVGAVLAVGTRDRWLGARSGDPAPASANAVETNGQIDLGVVENGTFVKVPIEFTNRTGRSAALSEFKSDCSCLQIYQEVDGRRERFVSIPVPPGDSKTVFVDLRVGSDLGARRAVRVSFRDDTCSPPYRVVNIGYVPAAHLYAVPQSVTFGEIPVGESAVRTVELRSDGSYTNPIKTVTCTPSDRLSAAFNPATDAEKTRFEKEHPGQFLLGRLDLTATASAVGVFDIQAVVSHDGKELIRVPASGTGIADYRIVPGAVVLPRLGSGGPEYVMAVACRSRSGAATLRWLPDEGSPFQVAAADAASPAGVTVRYTGPAPTTTREYALRFKATGGASESVLTLPVTVLAPE
jgi:hypothetical protein